jgi:hypothetical protein
MTLFFRRFVGALALSPAAFEDIEADRFTGFQSLLVVAAACLSGGFGVVGFGAAGPAGFAAASVIVLAGWLVWVGVIATVGTTRLAEPQTQSSVHELLRVLGYASAPGIFLAFAAIRPAAPIIVLIVATWMIAAAVVGVRQALDYKHTGRAIAVCAVALALAAGVMAAVGLLFATPVG